nr:ribonuclease H-like domain-containing protein [Tanacetum cinerariifolium]
MRRAQESRTGDEDYFNRALLDYEAETGVPFKLRHCWEVLKGSPKWMQKFGKASINLNVDVGDDKEDEVQEIRRPINMDKAKGFMKKKGPRASGSSITLITPSFFICIFVDIDFDINKDVVLAETAATFLIRYWEGKLLYGLGAMLDEYNALFMWLFKHKFKADGSLSMYKAHLVANERSQQQGIDCDETFSPVVKPATIRTVLSLAVFRDLLIHQLDVKNAFLHGHLSETVYMHQPPGFVDPNKPGYVCHLHRSLYGLKQAPRAWFQRFASYATRVGFQYSKTDSFLFVFHRGSDIACLLFFVDDIILTASSSAFLQRIIASLYSEFAMTDLGSLNYFLGISAQRSASGLFLSQSKFAEEILERAHMHSCNPCRTPVDTESKLGSDGEPISDPTLYRSLAGALRYLTWLPDLSYAVQQVCLYMHDPRDPHFTALKSILRYVGCPVTLRSTSGYCVFLGDNLLSWSAKRQVTLPRSSAEAEYRGVANVVAETAWIHNLLCELHTPLFTTTLVYCGNVSAVYMSANQVQHQRTKHIEIDIHFVRNFVASGQVRVFYFPSRFQYADIFTKGLPTALFIEFRSSLNVRRSSAHTKGSISIE